MPGHVTPPQDAIEPFRCSYCGDEKDRVPRSVEHPLSQTLGGRGWSVREVCDECNGYAGREVDAPFARQTWMVWFRHRHLVVNAQRKVPAAPRVIGRLKPTGERVLTVMDRTGWYIESLPERSKARTLGSSRKNLGPEITLAAPTRALIDDAEVEVEWTHDPTLWPRFGAKVGLGFGRELLGAGWLDSPSARYLRAVLFSRQAPRPPSYGPLGSVSQAVAGSDVAGLFLGAPEHVVWVTNAEDGAVLDLVLFGDQRYTVPLGGTVAPEALNTWVFDASRHLVERTSWRKYAERMTLRLSRP